MTRWAWGTLNEIIKRKRLKRLSIGLWRRICSSYNAAYSIYRYKIFLGWPVRDFFAAVITRSQSINKPS